MNNAQQQLPVGNQTWRRVDDFMGCGFPEGVLPTGGLHMLEQGDNLLIIKSHTKRIAIQKAQTHMFKLAVSFGKNPDAPGHITVVNVYGLGPTPRHVVIFDEFGVSEEKVMTLEQWQAWLLEWFKKAGSR